MPLLALAVTAIAIAFIQSYSAHRDGAIMNVFGIPMELLVGAVLVTSTVFVLPDSPFNMYMSHVGCGLLVSRLVVDAVGMGRRAAIKVNDAELDQ